MKQQCIIVDDEVMARKSLQRLCEQNESLELLKTFENAEDALAFLTTESVDLIWLDVEMPGLSGFDLLENLTAMPQVVMTTTKTEYAFNAFQYQVTDYLQKPITMPRFNMAVGKVLELASRKTSASPERQEIYIKTEGRYIRLPYSDIMYVENVGDYVKIVTKTQAHVVHATMKYLEEKLGSAFLRVHRSFIVHLDRIVDIEENNLVVANKVIPISRANKPELMNRLNLL
jgi:DNA-binding LytR/AlgR family response regulator